MRKIMASIDIGTDSIKLVVGEMFRNKLNILASLYEPIIGMEDGLIINEEDFKECLKRAISKADGIIGIPIKQVIITIPPRDLEFSVITGEIEITSDNHVISGLDVSKVFKEALHGQIKEGREYINLLPTSFTVSDGRKVRDPKGLASETLTARGILITAPQKNIYPILVALEKLGLDVLDISLSSIGDYYEYKIDEMRDNSGIIINIGHTSTDVSLFNKGILTNIESISVGAKNIENDLMYIYKIDSDTARDIKENLGLSYIRNAKEDNTIEVTDKYKDQIVINQLEVTKIIQSRIEEILNLCKKQINLLTKKEISYIIVTGGLTENRDFRLILNKIFKDKAIVGRVSELGVRHNRYGSSVGLIKYYDEKSRLKDKEYSIYSIEEQQALGGYDLDEENDSSIVKLFKNFFG